MDLLPVGTDRDISQSIRAVKGKGGVLGSFIRHPQACALPRLAQLRCGDDLGNS